MRGAEQARPQPPDPASAEPASTPGIAAPVSHETPTGDEPRLASGVRALGEEPGRELGRAEPARREFDGIAEAERATAERPAGVTLPAPLDAARAEPEEPAPGAVTPAPHETAGADAADRVLLEQKTGPAPEDTPAEAGVEPSEEPLPEAAYPEASGGTAPSVRGAEGPAGPGGADAPGEPRTPTGTPAGAPSRDDPVTVEEGSHRPGEVQHGGWPGQVSPDAATDGDPLAEPDRLRAVIEAVLLVVDSPTSSRALAQGLGRPLVEVEKALRDLRNEYDAGRRGMDLREVAGGWRLYTRDELAPYVERFVLDGQQARLTQAALETLAVVAYRQPVTRSRVSAIRGVNVDGVMRTLLSRGLVEECGADPDTGGGLYRTTSFFLERMGLTSLAELPSLAPLLPDTSQLDDVALST